MGQVLHTNGDYELRTAEDGTILLNTGPKRGRVLVTGDLIVEGDSVAITSEDLKVKDNIIILNDGETGVGVTLTYSGIAIDRGSLPHANVIFDESDRTWLFGTGSPQIGFNFANSKIKVKEILTDNTVDDGDLVLIGSGTGVVKVGSRSGTPYEQLVTDINDIPNKKYVDDAVTASLGNQIVQNDTRVILFDTDSPLDLSTFPIGPYLGNPADSQIAFLVNNRRVAIFTEQSFIMRGITISPEPPLGTDIESLPSSEAVTIKASNANTNLRLETNGSGKVQVTLAMQFDNTGLAPSTVANSSILYAGTVEGGGTGLYAANSGNRGELILKHKALLYSMIF